MPKSPLAIYVHWPYCARVCPYCDFNVYKQRKDEGLLPAILMDLQHWRDMSGPRQVSSLHFGGGTPSLMSPAQLGAIIEQVDTLWGLGDAEIALEANPHEAKEAAWRGYQQAGLTRLSLGVQSFDDAGLKFLGRDHDGAQAQKAVDLAMPLFSSVSADLIFGWQGQTQAVLTQDVNSLIASGVQHLSTYQLTIEAGTAFERAESRGQARAVDGDLSADYYEWVRDRLIEEGFDHYEVSNFAKPNHRSQHNLAYWRGQDYVGVGPGAHGRLTIEGQKRATIAHMRPDVYTAAVKETGRGIETTEILSDQSRAEESLLMGLRITEGVSLSQYERYAPESMSRSELTALIKEGLLHLENDRLSATEQGRLVLNAVTERLLLS